MQYVKNNNQIKQITAMKKFLKIFLGVLFAALLLGTFVFLWQKTRPVKVVYTIVQPKLDTLKPVSYTHLTLPTNREV